MFSRDEKTNTTGINRAALKESSTLGRGRGEAGTGKASFDKCSLEVCGLMERIEEKTIIFQEPKLSYTGLNVNSYLFINSTRTEIRFD